VTESQILTALQEDTYKVLHLYNDKKLNPGLRFCLGLLDKMYRVNEGLRPLILKYQNNSNYEYSICILLRSLLLDLMISSNCYIVLNNELTTSGDIEKIKEKVTQFSKIILSDGIQKSLVYLDDLVKHNLKTKEEANIVRDDFMNEFKDDILEGNDDKNDFFAPRKLFNIIMADKYLQHLNSIYDNYLLFSKFDHFNTFHFKVTKNEQYQIGLRIENTVRLLPFHAYLITKILMALDENCFRELKELKNSFGKLMAPEN
jgi:hypothetical protein